MKLLLILGIIIFTIFLVLLFSVKKIKERFTSQSKDIFVKGMHKKMFNYNIEGVRRDATFKINDKNIGYVGPYHNHNLNDKIQYIKDNYSDPFIIVLDGEPNEYKGADFNLSLTTKKYLSVSEPSKYIYWPQYTFNFIMKKYGSIQPEDLLKSDNWIKPLKTEFCAFGYSNCDEVKFKGVMYRRIFYELLQEKTGGKVTNIGKCYNPLYKPQKERGDINNRNIFGKYKFVVAFENEYIDGYITEKLLNPMLAGTIPIYLGAPDVGKYFNTKSFVNVRDFKTFENCIDYVLTLNSNDYLYDSMLKEPWLIDNKITEEMFSFVKGGKFYKELFKLSPKEIRMIIKPCNITFTKVHFITFADGNTYKVDRILKEAKDSGFFDKIDGYTPNDILPDFMKKHSDFIKNNKRGYGYFIWKPHFILEKLKSVDDGDFVVYCDSGCTIEKKGTEKMIEFYTLLENNDILCFDMEKNGHIEREWNKGDTVLRIFTDYNIPFSYENGILTSPQITSSNFMVRKTPKTMNFMEKWLGYAENYKMIDDSSSNVENKFLKEHRHDQAIFSLLCKVENVFILKGVWNDDKDYSKDLETRPIIATRKK